MERVVLTKDISRLKQAESRDLRVRYTLSMPRQSVLYLVMERSMVLMS